MDRLEGWEKLLSDFITEVSGKKFKRGSHDCALFAADCTKVITGIDFGSEYRGKYSTRRGAVDIVKKLGNKDLTELATEKFGSPLDNINLARRGDIVAVKYQDDVALAVIDLSGRRAITVGLQGIEHYPKVLWLQAWKV